MLLFVSARGAGLSTRDFAICLVISSTSYVDQCRLFQNSSGLKAVACSCSMLFCFKILDEIWHDSFHWFGHLFQGLAMNFFFRRSVPCEIVSMFPSNSNLDSDKSFITFVIKLGGIAKVVYKVKVRRNDYLTMPVLEILVVLTAGRILGGVALEVANASIRCCCETATAITAIANELQIEYDDNELVLVE